ncbi:ATP synthase mitochondrial F1 complex assembly factor 2 isoform X1 [Panthera tigris]|uniref:ATP synthase mitochondrial F1 complex assembly factor 2 isoform X1 n=1 Tax=Panthera tigris TaxID=9694 RepID=UPI001C6F7B53|nr:ATP synthase mitochondrial F1 complex assembly factor 2 isoform X1 [Panthera tigris]
MRLGSPGVCACVCVCFQCSLYLGLQNHFTVWLDSRSAAQQTGSALRAGVSFDSDPQVLFPFLEQGRYSLEVCSKPEVCPSACPLRSERKRFYQNVSITQGEGGFEINLDHRKLKTPQAKLFTVPSEALAIAVATEWDSQQDTIKFYTMHLTTLCNTSLDNPTQRNKDQLIQAAVKFLDTDTICYRVDEPATLVELQRNEWDPIIEWAEERYDVEIGSSTSIMGPSIPARTREVLTSHLASYNMWALQGIEFVVTQLKSMVLTLGLIDRRLTVEQAVLLSRLEEEYQIQKWGNIEWAHGYELRELRARTAAGTLFVHLCSESATVKHKLLRQ